MSESISENAGVESKLLDRLKAGDEAAYEQLVREHGGRMLAVAKRMLRSDDDARDAVQEAFISAFKAIDRFEGNSLLATWLHQIVVNAALMKLRSGRRKPEQPIDELLPTFLEDGHITDPASPWREVGDDPVQRRQLAALMQAALDTLPESYRNVLLLRDIEDLDTEETSEIMGISQGAVKTRLHRARQALRGLLEPHMAEGGI